ncbi:MAG TPA: hypothetical protein P5164_05660 [Thermoanaerobaculia bacterium]|nr:hypothetical protein [Thermoanaerobaculia bacterium]
MPHKYAKSAGANGARRQGKRDNWQGKDSTAAPGRNRPVSSTSPERKSARLGAPARKPAERIAWERELSRFLGDSPCSAEHERPGGVNLYRAAGRIERLAEAIARELDVHPTSALEFALMSLVMNDPAVWPKETR